MSKKNLTALPPFRTGGCITIEGSMYMIESIVQTYDEQGQDLHFNIILKQLSAPIDKELN